MRDTILILVFLAQSLGAEDGAAPVLRVLSWNWKHAAQSDWDRIAHVLETADLAVVQGVELNERGQKELNVVANLLQTRSNEKICRGWFRDGPSKRGQTALIWRERALAWVDNHGELREVCAAHSSIFLNASENSAGATFLFKAGHKLFTLSAVGFNGTPKNPDRDLPALFKDFRKTGWGVIATGDFAFSTSHPAFAEVRRWDFTPAWSRSAKIKNHPYQNFWFKNVHLVNADVINLHERFSEKAAEDVNSDISESFPLYAEFSFSEKKEPGVQVQLLAKQKSPAPEVEQEVADTSPGYAGPVQPGQLSDLKEDLESEAGDMERPDSATRSIKNSAKKKKSK